LAKENGNWKRNRRNEKDLQRQDRNSAVVVEVEGIKEE
jgi:hypothetical protein